MTQANPRINMMINDFNDPFWSQVLEGAHQAAQALGVELAIWHEDLPYEPSDDAETALLEELLALKSRVLIDWGMPNRVIHELLEAGVALVHLAESSIDHPLSFSPVGLYDAACMAGNYMAGMLPDNARILLVGGMKSSRRAEMGHSRVNGFLQAFKNRPQIIIEHAQSGWAYNNGYDAVQEILASCPENFDAIFGLSDTLAIAAQEALHHAGRLKPGTLLMGINGDPSALTAIAAGKMTATIETSAAALSRDAIKVANCIARGEKVPQTYSYQLRLVTAENVHQVAAEKLFSIAELPGRLVSIDQRINNERYLQLKTSLEINRRVGSILDLQRLSDEIAELIRSNYGYDYVKLYRWIQESNQLIPESTSDTDIQALQPDENSLLTKALRRGIPLFIANTQQYQRLTPSDQLSSTRSRLILPIHFSNNITHVLDLQSKGAMFHTRQELVGLQSLADQFGIAIRNAELYKDVLTSREEALQSKTRAEKADNLKTRLLANVSHELRTPLNIILGYSESALAEPNPYGLTLPQEFRNDLGHIQENGEHLIRLINDLLDLSRAEIDALDLFMEVINPRNLIAEAFHSMAGSVTKNSYITWRLDIPEHLPSIQVDPLRLRQILLNLLSNARKFTQHGEIILGADVSLPHLHIWIKDTGLGIPVESQEKIFEPFITVQNATQRHSGIGLGLTITRKLIALHGGSLSLESQPDLGSTFHVYLPLPNLAAKKLPVSFNPNAEPAALLISHKDTPSLALTMFCKRQNLHPIRLHDTEELSELLTRIQPRVVAWDIKQASPNDWSLIQSIRTHPLLSQLPFLLLNNEEEPSQPAQVAMTNVFLKPVLGETLLKFIEAMRPQQNAGTILVVDDDRNALEMYQALLSREFSGFQVLAFSAGADALNYLSHETPSLILLDLMMPDIDGFKVLEFVRSQPRTASVPVLVLSGQILSYEDVKRLNHNRVIFQPKNVLDPGELAEQMNHALTGKTTLPQGTSELVKRALVFILQNYERTFALPEIANAVGASKNYLSQVFHEEMDMHLWDYLNRYRIHKAKDLLLTTQMPITEIALRVGFEDFSYFGRVFNKYCGCSPRSFRKQPQSED